LRGVQSLRDELLLLMKGEVRADIEIEIGRDGDPPASLASSG
jgi:hypothetical protein